MTVLYTLFSRSICRRMPSRDFTVPFGHKARQLDTSAAGQQLADVGATTHDQPDGRITLLGPNLLEHSIGLTAPPSTSRIAV